MTESEHAYEVIRYCTDEYLSYIRNISARVQSCRDDIEMLQSRLMPGAVRYDGVGGGTRQDIADVLQRIDELKARWADSMSEWEREWALCRELCSPGHPERYVLFKHEVEWRGLTWDEVSARFKANPARYAYLAYEPVTLRKMARKGRVELYEAMPERWRSMTIPDAMG